MENIFNYETDVDENATPLYHEFMAENRRKKMNRKIRMTLIATYPKMADIFLRLTAEYKDVEAASIYASFERAVEIAKELEAKGETDVILSRGGTAAQIQDAVNIPVVFIPITPFDVIQIVHELPKEEKEIAFIHYMKNVYGIQKIAEMYKIHIEEYSFINFFDIEDAVKSACKQGIHCLIGGEVAVRIAKKMGMLGYQVSAGNEPVERAIKEAIAVVNARRKEQNHAMQLKAAYDSLKEGIVVTDEKKRIVMFNSVAQKLFGGRYKPGDTVGDSIINEKCASVYRTQREETVYLRTFGKETYAVTHIPIKEQGEFIGVVSHMEDVNKTQELEKKIRKELHQKGFRAKYFFKDIVTGAPDMLRVIQRAKAFARADSAVLIEGESGTGKELMAQSIHNESLRKDGPFVAVNCAAIPENLLESELFGYEAGAFTGAKKEGKAGLFELAHRGTLFLDEIGEISKGVQTRLLRVLQEKEIMRVGGNKIVPIDVRIISATNQNLKALSADGKFRTDLYYRLSVLQLYIPPLRKRAGDVALLAGKFLMKYNTDVSVLETVLPYLTSYTWPGNIRELQNTMERYGVLLEVIGEEGLKEEDLSEILGTKAIRQSCNALNLEIELGSTWNEIMGKVEYAVANRYLEEFDHNQELAAKALGIGRTTLWRKMKGKEEENL